MQGTVMPVVVRYTRVREGPMYISTATVFFNEIIKLYVCLIVLAVFIEPNLKTLFVKLKVCCFEAQASIEIDDSD